MSRLTVRLPNMLHAQLDALARGEGVSLNQYIVYALTRQATLDQAHHDTRSAAGHAHTAPHMPQALDSFQAVSSDPADGENRSQDMLPPPIQPQD